MSEGFFDDDEEDSHDEDDMHDRSRWPEVPESALEPVKGLPLLPTCNRFIKEYFLIPRHNEIPRCIVLDAEDLFFRGTGYDRNERCPMFDPAALFAWMRYFLVNDFQVVAICSPHYLSPYHVLQPDLLQILAANSLMEFPDSMENPKNVFRVLEYTKKIGGVVFSSNDFKKFNDIPGVEKISSRYRLTPIYEGTLLPDTFWFNKSGEGKHWLAYHELHIAEWRETEEAFRSRLYAVRGLPYFERARKRRSEWTPEWREHMVNLLDYIIMKREGQPCGYREGISQQTQRLRIRMKKEVVLEEAKQRMKQRNQKMEKKLRSELSKRVDWDGVD